MSQATSILAKANAILNKYCPLDRTVYIRTLSAIAPTDDDLIGSYSPVSSTDRLMSPQPYFQRIGREHIPGGHAMAYDILRTSGASTVLADDYVFYISASSISLVEMNSSQTFLVLKTATEEEVLRLIDPVVYSMQGTDVLFEVFYRSISRPNG